MKNVADNSSAEPIKSGKVSSSPEDHRKISGALEQLLACPICLAPLRLSFEGAQCTGCGDRYPIAESGQLDMRLRRQVLRTLEARLGPSASRPADEIFEPLAGGFGQDTPEREISPRLTWEAVSHFPVASRRGELALDCGCGSAVHRELIESLGYEYVGIDIRQAQATLLGDAQALPFTDESFAFVLSVAVLEHVPYPMAMSNEVFRVLKAGAVFAGSVAFHEPFHGDSYYHHTHLGTWNVLNAAGFQVQAVAPRLAWDSFAAQASMGLLPRAPRWLAAAAVEPVRLLRRVWFAVGYRLTGSENARRARGALFNSGAYTFIARKPEEPGIGPVAQEREGVGL